VRIRAALVAAALFCLAVLAGCGGGDKKKLGSGLAWDGTPQVFSLRDLPSDRVLIGKVVNDSGHTLHLSAAKLSVRDAAGRTIRSSGAYTATFAHGLFGAFQQPSKVPQPEAARLGHDIYLIPKMSSPFYTAWRIPAGSKGPFYVEYGGRAPLKIPAATKPAAR
jgi:hypothetical protein